MSLYCNPILFYLIFCSKKNHSGKILHEAPLTKARMGVALMKAVPLVSFLVVLRRAWRLDQIMVKNRRRGNRGNPWEILKEIVIWDMCMILIDLIWYGMMVFDLLHAFGIRFIILNMLWHVLVIQAVWVPWRLKLKTVFFLQPFVFCFRLPWKRDMGWFGVWEGRAFGSWHAPPLRCGLLWSCFSTSISGGRVGRCFPLQSLLVLRRWCFVYTT